jgi:hypothetical protein
MDRTLVLWVVLHPTRSPTSSRCSPTLLRAIPAGSAKTLIPALGSSLGDVSYHVRKLSDAGLAVEVDKRQVRGALQSATG